MNGTAEMRPSSKGMIIDVDSQTATQSVNTGGFAFDFIDNQYCKSEDGTILALANNHQALVVVELSKDAQKENLLLR